MQIHVRYFAVARERLKKEEETIELPQGANVSTALDALSARHDAIAALRPCLRAAVNQEWASNSEPLHDGDELALIPPVAGGHDRPRLARIVDDRAPSIDATLAAVSSPGMGGVVTFTGLVRDESHGCKVERLEYEAYSEMAEKVFRDLCDEIECEVPGVRIAVEHRVGKLVVGDVAVVIACAAPHRKEAFTACQAMIDRLKERAPIWKKEIGPDGASWVGMGP
ncbi:MAG: molybdopterin converting factor subunit 1 [Deltaproteobacteria bacterium]|nr:molybdopterin converting factor subunit 1 [Deltaproteobacteria bacterium]